MTTGTKIGMAVGISLIVLGVGSLVVGGVRLKSTYQHSFESLY